MAKEIKFRAKRVDNGEWTYGVPIPNGFGEKVFMVNLILGDKVAYPLERLHEYCVEIIPETIDRYFGQDDRHGNEVYGHHVLADESGQRYYLEDINEIEEISTLLTMERLEIVNENDL